MRRSSRSAAISSSEGAITRHGPHHGAQRSTRTAFSFSSTSAWKLPSVTSLMSPATSAPLLVRVASESIATGPQRGDLPDRLERDPGRHLRRTRLAIAEHDRYLAHPIARLDRPVGQLDLETVPVGMHALVVDSLEDGPAEALEAARQVPHR